MSDEKIEVNKELISELFNIVGTPVPEKISDEDLLNVVFKLKNAQFDAAPDTFDNFNSTSNNILVIDDIGVVTYQLKILFTNLGYSVHTAKDIFSGLNTFIKSNYAFLVMDLFVSTEQEGYMLLKEVKKIITKNNLGTKIIVITASNKAENKVKCLNGGADVFLKKESGWQDRLAEIVENFNNSLTQDDESMSLD